MTGTRLIFKFFATQCTTEVTAATTSPGRGATASSKIHGRPRKTLKALIDTPSDEKANEVSSARELRALGYTLQDLFVSSSSPPPRAALLPLRQAGIAIHEGDRSIVIKRGRRCGGFRKRLIRQPWRPVLVAIPE